MTINESSTKRALVIGAGIAGLITARVLSDYYEHVLIVERDTFSDALEPRTGTPQAFHVHRIIPRGKLILEQLFPGYIDDLTAAGAYETQQKPVTMVKSTGIFHALQPDKDISCSRALLEWEIRRRVQTLTNVSFLTNQEVIGLRMSPDHENITGITVRERGQIDQQAAINAEMVIDASGRTSKLGQWLQDLGFLLPKSEKIHSFIGYSTRFYKASPQVIENIGTMIVDEMQAQGTFGVGALPIENETLWVTLFGIGEHYPSTDPDGYERDLANLHLIHTQLADELAKAEPLTSPRGYRVPVCVRHHYERADQWPTGLLVLGDAFCHFDPIYGQGMSVAAIEATTLASSLQEQKNNPQPDFERRTLKRMQEEAIAPAWWLSVINDLRGVKVNYEGNEMPQGVALLHRYMDLYFQYALEHPVEEAEVLSSHLPTIAKLFLLNGLLFPPNTVFNTSTLMILLKEEETLEEPHTLRQLVEQSSLSPDAVMESILPTFEA